MAPGLHWCISVFLLTTLTLSVKYSLCFFFMSTTPSSSWCVWTGLESLSGHLFWRSSLDMHGLHPQNPGDYVLFITSCSPPQMASLSLQSSDITGPATFQFLKWAVLPSARHHLPFSFWLIFQEWILIYKTLLSWGANFSENQSPGSKFSSLVV